MNLNKTATKIYLENFIDILNKEQNLKIYKDNFQLYELFYTKSYIYENYTDIYGIKLDNITTYQNTLLYIGNTLDKNIIFNYYLLCNPIDPKFQQFKLNKDLFVINQSFSHYNGILTNDKKIIRINIKKIKKYHDRYNNIEERLII